MSSKCGVVWVKECKFAHNKELQENMALHSKDLGSRSVQGVSPSVLFAS